MKDQYIVGLAIFISSFIFLILVLIALFEVKDFLVYTIQSIKSKNGIFYSKYFYRLYFTTNKNKTKKF